MCLCTGLCPDVGYTKLTDSIVATWPVAALLLIVVVHDGLCKLLGLH